MLSPEVVHNKAQSEHGERQSDDQAPSSQAIMRHFVAVRLPWPLPSNCHATATASYADARRQEWLCKSAILLRRTTKPRLFARTIALDSARALCTAVTGSRPSILCAPQPSRTGSSPASFTSARRRDGFAALPGLRLRQGDLRGAVQADVHGGLWCAAGRAVCHPLCRGRVLKAVSTAEKRRLKLLRRRRATRSDSATRPISRVPVLQVAGTSSAATRSFFLRSVHLFRRSEERGNRTAWCHPARIPLLRFRSFAVRL
jgi:hypothetical protein